MKRTGKHLFRRMLLILILLGAFSAVFIQTPYFGKLYYPYRYRDVIESNAEAFAVDPLLVAAIIRVESKFHPQAVSRKGAVGLMQIMPTTAEWIAPHIGIEDFREEMLLDPEINIKLGTWYLNSLAREFDNRLDVIIAAYNGGRGKVSSWLEEEVWSGMFEDRQDIPFHETRFFLFKVRMTYDRYRELYATE